MRQAFERRRDLIVGLAKQIPGFNVTVPDGAFYIFPEVSALFGKKAGDKVILAGGKGKRLWPVSRENMPKQFLDFFSTAALTLPIASMSFSSEVA